VTASAAWSAIPPGYSPFKAHAPGGLVELRGKTKGLTFEVP
jgi:hypothetical protein